MLGFFNMDNNQIDNNQIFSYLLYLTGFSNNKEKLIQLLEEKDFKITKSQMRSWSRKSGLANSRPAPDKLLFLLFRILFDEKNKNNKFCQYPDDNTKTK